MQDLSGIMTSYFFSIEVPPELNENFTDYISSEFICVSAMPPPLDYL